MKTIRIFFIFMQVVAVCSFSASAQDFLVTTKNDTLNCKLGKLENGKYPITFYMGNEKVTGYIHQDSILAIKKNVFRSLRNNALLPWYPLRDVGIDVGVAHQFEYLRIEDDLRPGKSDFAIRTGFYAGADMTFYTSPSVGYGLKYNFRSLSGGDIRYQYVGVLMGFRIWDKSRKNHWFLNVSPGFGWIVLKDAPVDIPPQRLRVEMHANTFAGDFAVGYNFRVAENISVRAKLSYVLGYPQKVKVPEIREKIFEIGRYCDNMNTLNLSVGMTFHRKKPLD